MKEQLQKFKKQNNLSNHAGNDGFLDIVTNSAGLGGAVELKK